MEEITIDLIKEHLEKDENTLIATQHRICLPVVKRIYKKMIYGIKFDDIKVCGDLIMDGHHRYVGALLANYELGKVKTQKSSATKTYEWGEVELVENEWDTDDKIHIMNKVDAEFNDLPLEEIIKILN